MATGEQVMTMHEQSNGMQYNNKIALLFRDCRQDMEMTLKDVSRVTGLSVSYLSRFERGFHTPELNVLVSMFHAINYNLEIVAIPDGMDNDV